MPREVGAERHRSATTMYQDYSGAFCALVCLRSALSEASKALKVWRVDRVQTIHTEIRYWERAVVERRASARLHHGYKAPLPDMPDVIGPTRRSR